LGGVFFSPIKDEEFLKEAFSPFFPSKTPFFPAGDPDSSFDARLEPSLFPPPFSLASGYRYFHTSSVFFFHSWDAPTLSSARQVFLLFFFSNAMFLSLGWPRRPQPPFRPAESRPSLFPFFSERDFFPFRS